jgi:hypothetical protein
MVLLAAKRMRTKNLSLKPMPYYSNTE